MRAPLGYSAMFQHQDLIGAPHSLESVRNHDNFIHDLSTIDAECYRNYIEATGSDAFTSGRASENLLHLLSSGFYSSLLELVVHNISREDAEKDMARLRKFYTVGWEHILHP